MEKPEIVAVGHLCLDTIGVLPEYPLENTSHHIEEATRQPGGPASQAAVAFQRLGGQSGFIGNIGDDSNGDLLYQDLIQEGIDVSCVERKTGIHNFSFICVGALNHSRTMFNYHDKLPAIEFTHSKRIYIAEAKFLHVDTTHYENAMNAAKVAKELHVPISMDACSMKSDNQLNLELARMADILIMNEEYPKRLMEDDNATRALLNIAKWGQKVVISTIGEKGCLAVIDGKVEHFAAFKVNCVDSTGAGDVFHGSFLRALLLGYDIRQAIRFSSAVSACKCQSLGGRAGIPNLSRTLQFLEEHKGEI